MIYSDFFIEENLEDLFPVSHPGNRTIDRLVQVQPASIDLRLGDSWIDPSTMGRGKIPESGLLLEPGHDNFILGETMEYIRLPHHIVGRVDGRSSLGRMGLRVHSTAGFIDPGFEGIITLEIDLVGSKPLYLRPGMRVCQVSLHKMDRPARRPYGAATRKSKYQGSTTVTPSRLEQDDDA